MYKNIIYALSLASLLLVLFMIIRSLKQTKKIATYLFSAVTIFTLVWVSSLWIADTTTNYNLALAFVNFGVFCVTALTTFFLFFAINYPHRDSKRRILLKIVLFLFNIFILIQALDKQIIYEVELTSYGATIESSSIIYLIHNVQAYAFMVFGLLVLNSKKSHAGDLERARINLMTWGITVAFVANVLSGTVAAYVDGFGWLIFVATASLVFFVGTIAYSILRHQLFDVSSFVARSTGYLFTILSVGLIYALLVIGLGTRLFNFEPATFLQNTFYVVSAITIAFSFPSIKGFFNKLTNRIFYRDAYEPQDLLNNLNDSLVSTIEVDTIMKNTAQILERYLKPEYVIFFIPKSASNDDKIFCTNSKVNQDEIIEIAKGFRSRISLVAQVTNVAEHISKAAHKHDIGIVVKLISPDEKETVGMLIFGAKKSGSLYAQQDLRVTEIIANGLVIAIQNALRFEEIQHFNITLQEEVKKQTAQLREANKRLKLLDQTKDDFISMASHQLRTPLTSVKGYLSMVLEGDAGKVSSKEKKLLNQAFISSQRMVYLIADLLNVSRLRTGKFVIENSETNLAQVIEDEVGQLVETAEAKGLTLTYHKPKDFPTLMLDETKMRQVVMNFMDNSVHYTPSGGHIDVELKDTGKTIEYTVKDDGIGVPKSEQHNLFSKFYRAPNAKKARPDGTGLGLYMAQKVIVAQGGSIIFQSQEGKGSTFGFSIEKSKLEKS